MQKYLLLLLLTTTTSISFGQDIDKIINRTEVERIEKILSSDEMQGRRIFTPGINKAADFIANEFKVAALQTWNGGKTYKQEFAVVRPKFISASGSFNKQ